MILMKQEDKEETIKEGRSIEARLKDELKEGKAKEGGEK